MYKPGQGDKKNIKNIWILFLFISTLVFLMVITGCGAEETGADKEKPEKEEEKIEEEKGVDLEAIECNFCGAEKDGDYQVLDRPFLITYGNSPDERPHSGISKACIVYEIRVEGARTRLLALFNKEVPGDIGNIRSLRLDFIPLIRENDPYYVHVGGHQPALNRISALGIANLSEFYHAGFWRSSNRRAPFNVYSTIPDLINSGESQGYRDEGERQEFLNFRDEESISHSSDSAQSIQINYGTNSNIVNYEYDETKKVYLRSVDGEPHLDREHDDEITATNIIIQYASSRVVDDVGRRDTSIVGRGSGKYVSKGEMIPITWEKENEESPTHYYDKDGNQIKLYPGQTWVNIVEDDKVLID